GLGVVDTDGFLQVLLCGVDVLGSLDGGDHQVDLVESLDEPFDDVETLFRLVEAVLGAPDDDTQLMLHPHAEHLRQVQQPRFSVDEGDMLDGEPLLQRGVLVQQGEDRFGVDARLQVDDDAQARVAVGVVGDVADAVQAAFFDLFDDCGDELLGSDLVRQLVDDELGAAPFGGDSGAAPDGDVAFSGAVRLVQVLPAEDGAAGGEVGSEDVLAQVIWGGFRVPQQQLG